MTMPQSHTFAVNKFGDYWGETAFGGSSPRLWAFRIANLNQQSRILARSNLILKRHISPHPKRRQDRMTSKADHVKALFDVPGKYLGPRRFDIEIRVETVQEFTKNLTFDRVLDIGCGNGDRKSTR